MKKKFSKVKGNVKKMEIKVDKIVGNFHKKIEVNIERKIGETLGKRLEDKIEQLEKKIHDVLFY